MFLTILFLSSAFMLVAILQGAISGSFNFAKLAISAEAARLIYYAKVQLLLILIETLDLENLLQMIHDEIPFRFVVSAYFPYCTRIRINSKVSFLVVEFIFQTC